MFSDTPSEIGFIYRSGDEITSLDYDMTGSYQVQVDPQLVSDVIDQYSGSDLMACIRFESGKKYTSSSSMSAAFDALKAGDNYTMDANSAY